VNLLVTNTRNGQAYAIIRALRPYARKIVVTMYGKNRFVARLIYRLRVSLGRESAVHPGNAPMTLRELLQSYGRKYFSRKKRLFGPYFRYFFQDPAVSLLWWLQLLNLAVRAAKKIGR
jgi:hypothetical protein